MFLKWPCVAPSIRSPENYSECLCAHPHPQRCARSHGTSSSVSLWAPGAELDLIGMRPTCSPEWTEDERVRGRPTGSRSTGVCRCTRLAPWGTVRGPKAGWHYCRALLNLHLETRQLGFTDMKKRRVTHTYVLGRWKSVLQAQDWCPQGDGTLFLPITVNPPPSQASTNGSDEGLVTH